MFVQGFPSSRGLRQNVIIGDLMKLRKLDELRFDNTYRFLPEDFYHVVDPEGFQNPHLVAFNPDAAELMDLDPNEAMNPLFPEYFSGKKLLPGSEPLAMYYTGHQFGVYNPDIGDGRAILLGEVRNQGGEKWDLHLKGSGRTRYSRVFDGRAVLRSTIREYLCSEAMHALSIPTTRALCIVGSDEKVERETTERGAMLLRMSPSHVRFGSFEAFHYTGRDDSLKILSDYVISEHYPELLDSDNKPLHLLEQLTDRTAKLIAKWQAAGFTHGVMNTDNMSILGLTIDYGPYGFMEEYDPEYTPNHSDSFGRYSFENQPGIAFWNLGKLASALSTLVPREDAQQAVGTFKQLYSQYFLEIMRKKLGFKTSQSNDGLLITGLLEVMRDENKDYTNTFRALSDYSTAEGNEVSSDSEALEDWSHKYGDRLKYEDSSDSERKVLMDSINPKFILRNSLAERAIRKAEDESDYSEIEKLHRILKDPFSEQPEFEDYAKPSPEGKNLVISCSS